MKGGLFLLAIKRDDFPVERVQGEAFTILRGSRALFRHLQAVLPTRRARRFCFHTNEVSRSVRRDKVEIFKTRRIGIANRRDQFFLRGKQRQLKPRFFLLNFDARSLACG